MAHTSQRLEAVAEAVQTLTGAAAQALALPDLAAGYSDIQSKHREVYEAHNLAAVALAAALPRIAASLGSDWSPLDDPTGPALLFIAWRPLLEHTDPTHPGGGRLLQGSGASFSIPNATSGSRSVDLFTLSSSVDPYMRLICELVLPPLRADVANHWDPREAAVMERFLGAWEPALPVAALEYITHHLVLPRLRATVGEWDPMKDPIAPHIWLHPWLPYLGQQMTELWPVIRYKFSTALAQWHPADGSVLAILGPWRRVFGPREWDQLIGRAVVPKLTAALAEFVVNPADQRLDEFEWTMAWTGFMSTQQMVSVNAAAAAAAAAAALFMLFL